MDGWINRLVMAGAVFAWGREGNGIKRGEIWSRDSLSGGVRNETRDVIYSQRNPLSKKGLERRLTKTAT